MEIAIAIAVVAVIAGVFIYGKRKAGRNGTQGGGGGGPSKS